VVHGVQLAVLGFIGLCGALHDAAGAAGPPWVQQLAAVLVVLALVVACIATVLVAAEAWPVRETAPGAGPRTRRTIGNLRLGIALTFVSVGLTALATTSSWWPADDSDETLVTVSTARGSLCGQLLDSSDGTVRLGLTGRSVAVPLDQVTGVEPVTAAIDVAPPVAVTTTTAPFAPGQVPPMTIPVPVPPKMTLDVPAMAVPVPGGVVGGANGTVDIPLPDGIGADGVVFLRLVADASMGIAGDAVLSLVEVGK
jgi:hypothetical protein